MKTNPMDTVSAVNTLAEFLAQRSINRLGKNDLAAFLGEDQADLLILLGSSILYSAELAAAAYTGGLAKKLMIVGGVGHSTFLLRKAVAEHPAYGHIDVEDRPEADILADVISCASSVPKQDIWLERESTNCGNNATYAFRMLKDRGSMPRSIIVIQDPTMQRRSMASFAKAWENEDGAVRWISYAPFIPRVRLEDGEPVFDGMEIYGPVWTMDRFLSLLMGELPRLADNAGGYGPEGKNFIVHVDIPDDVRNAYERLIPVYGHHVRGPA